MPALAFVPGVARCVVSGTASGQPIINVFHVQNGLTPGTPFSAGQVDALAVGMATAFGAHLRPLCSAQYSGDTVEVTDLSSETGPTGFAALSGTGVGTGANTPNSAAAVISWKINRHYRGGHPRTYIGPLSNASIETPTTLTANYITSLITGSSAFHAAISALSAGGLSNPRLCTVHRVINRVQVPNPPVSVIIDSSADSRIDSMRRRLGPDR